MASSFDVLDAWWRARTGGDPKNGGGWCPYLPGVGASPGIDRSNTDAPWVTFDGSAITAATAGVSATVTVTGYTVSNDDIGNVFQTDASPGVNFIADFYCIKAVNVGANTWTFTKNCSSGIGVGLKGRMGGAFAHPYKSLAISSVSGTNNPILATPLLGGNRIYVQGGTYACADDWFMPSGGNLNVAGGNIRVLNFDGEVQFTHNGLISFIGDGYYYEGLMGTPGTAGFYLNQTAGTVTNHPWFDRPTISFSNARFNTGGFQSTWPGIWRAGNGVDWGASMICFEVDNTGGGAADATSAALRLEHGGGVIFAGCVKRQRGYALSATGSAWACHSVLFTGNLSDVAVDDESDVSGSVAAVMLNCTLADNIGNTWVGASNAMNTMAMFNNIYSGIPAAKFAMSWADTYKLNTQKNRFPVGYNCYWDVGGAGGTTYFNSVGGSPTWALNPPDDGTLVGDLNVNPLYANAGAGDYRVTNPLLLGTGISQAPGLPFSLQLDYGALRR